MLITVRKTSRILIIEGILVGSGRTFKFVTKEKVSETEIETLEEKRV